MDALAIALLVLGLLTIVVGSIMMLVAAFRESVWWGLGCLLFSPVGLVFLILHWGQAKRGFLTHLAGLVILIGGVFASPQVRESVTVQIAKNVPEGVNVPLLEKPKPPVDINVQITQKRGEIDQLDEQVRQQSAAVSQQFQALNARRAALKSTDAAAVTAFNAEVAAYQQANASLKQVRDQAGAAQLELTELLNERSRRQAAGGAQPGGNAAPGRPAVARSAGKHGPVIIYSTSHCPWCVKAKQYFASKGVSYDERDIERSPSARSEFEKLGGNGVPLIMVGSEKMEGFNQQRLDQLL